MNESLWTRRLDDPRPAVRRAAYALVSACCRHAPGLLCPPPPPPPRPPAAGASTSVSPEDADAAAEGGGGGTGTAFNGENGNGAGGAAKKRGAGGAGAAGGGRRSRVATPPLLVGLLSEKEEANHREAWQAALLLLREFRETWPAEKGAGVSCLGAVGGPLAGWGDGVYCVVHVVL